MKTQDKEQSLIEAAEKAFEAVYQRGDRVSDLKYQFYKNGFYEGAKSQAAKEYHKQEWIAVSDELPKHSKPVLVHDGEFCEIAFYGWLELYKKTKRKTWLRTFEEDETYPTHWMELPIINKEEQ